MSKQPSGLIIRLRAIWLVLTRPYFIVHACDKKWQVKSLSHAPIAMIERFTPKVARSIKMDGLKKAGHTTNKNNYH